MDKQQKNLLTILLNGSPVLEYDRNKQLSSAQCESLKVMEEKLSRGITLQGKFIADPNFEQRVEFISANMVAAILNDQDSLSAVSCAYLANALPELKQVKTFENSNQVSIELIFDREYQNENKLNFTPIEKLTNTQH